MAAKKKAEPTEGPALLPTLMTLGNPHASITVPAAGQLVITGPGGTVRFSVAEDTAVPYTPHEAGSYTAQLGELAVEWVVD